jgi:galactosylceramidase
MCALFTYSATIAIDGTGAGRKYDGTGGVSGGGATSVLLMSYPEPQRSQILDYLFKPKFGASMNAFFCEIGGDCNSTQGSEPSHMHTRNDTNFQRGYEWFLIKEAKKRNPDITLDGVAWGCPYWIGNNNFWNTNSTDMYDYYIQWIKGLKKTYGYDLDAIGCRNESGTNYTFAKQFRARLNAMGYSNVKLHAFDNWGGTKYDFVNTLTTDTALKNAVDIIGAHTIWNSTWSETKIPLPANVLATGKPIWNTEEHCYFNGFDCATAVVNACNECYIDSKCTKMLFWHLISATYPIEAYYDKTVGVSSNPWSGNYVINPALWGYAHYGQFVKVGWKYIDNACGKLAGGGTYVTLRSPDTSDFSVVIETKGVTAGQTQTFTIAGGLPTTKTLCVWRSNSTAQFVKQADITPVNGSFSLTIDANSIYSISTTTGQQKGTFATPIPAAQTFPLPYYETYDHYSSARKFGYLPYYHADIDGVFEIANRPDGTGKCLKQVLNTKAQSWAPEWCPYTIIGDRNWTNYEVSADISFDVTDTNAWASVIGRINGVGTGYGCPLKGYYLRLKTNGAWALYSATGSTNLGTVLSSGNVTLTGLWHNVKLRFSGTTLTGFIENVQVTSITNSTHTSGMAGLGTGISVTARNTAMFDNLLINTVGGTTPAPTVFAQDSTPPYPDSLPVSITKTVSAKSVVTSNVMTFKTIKSEFTVPAVFAGKNVQFSVYTLSGKLLQQGITRNNAPIVLQKYNRVINEVRLIRLKVVQ